MSYLTLIFVLLVVVMLIVAGIFGAVCYEAGVRRGRELSVVTAAAGRHHAGGSRQGATEIVEAVRRERLSADTQLWPIIDADEVPAGRELVAA